MSGRDDESCDIMRHHATSRDTMRSGAGGIRRHSSEGVAEEGRGGGSGSGRQAGVGSGSGRRVGVGSVRGSPYSVALVGSSLLLFILYLLIYNRTLTRAHLMGCRAETPPCHIKILAGRLGITNLCYGLCYVFPYFLTWSHVVDN